MGKRTQVNFPLRRLFDLDLIRQKILELRQRKDALKTTVDEQIIHLIQTKIGDRSLTVEEQTEISQAKARLYLELLSEIEFQLMLYEALERLSRGF